MGLVRCVLIWAALQGGAFAAAAEPQGPGSIASAVPVEVAEVVSGGNWIDGAASGLFRTVTIQGVGPAETVQVYLQWVGSRSPVAPIEVISSLALREFNELQLASASVTLEGDDDGLARIVITGQDTDARATAPITFLASLPGVYKVVPPEAAPR